MQLRSVELIKEASKQIADGFQKLGGGPLSWFIDQLVAHSEALMKYAPFQPGERCKIAVPPACTGGWQGSEDTLSHGRYGVVVDLGHDQGGFYFQWVPDIETYWDEAAKEYKKKTHKSSYMLRASNLAKLEAQIPGTTPTAWFSPTTTGEKAWDLSKPSGE